MTTARQRFQVSGFRDGFSKMAGTIEFECACDYALLELLEELRPNTTGNQPTDPYIGLDSNAQVQGAKRLLEILKHLHEPVKTPTIPKRETLNYADRTSTRPSRTAASPSPGPSSAA